MIMSGSSLIFPQESNFKESLKTWVSNEKAKYLRVERATEATPKSWGAQSSNFTEQHWNQTVNLGGDYKPHKSEFEPIPVSLILRTW